MKRHITVTVIFSFSIFFLNAQDARISRPWSEPFLINPALSGNFNGSVKLGTGGSWQQNKENKVAHQFSTYDIHIARKKQKASNNINPKGSKENNDNRYIGLTFAHYGYGKDLYKIYPNKNPINANFFSGSLSYNFNLSKDNVHSMGIGSQFVYATSSINETRGLYDKEISGGGFQWTELEDVGTNVKGGLDYLDFNFGGYYRYRTEGIVFEIGLGAYHYFWPKNALKNTIASLKALRARNVVHGSAEIILPNKRSLFFRSIFWKEGLYFRSKKLDAYDISSTWNSFEISDKKMKHQIRFTWGLGVRSFQTIMPFVDVNLGNSLMLSASYERPLRIDSEANYFAKRLELGAKLILK
jgi:hypothetical protein